MAGHEICTVYKVNHLESLIVIFLGERKEEISSYHNKQILSIASLLHNLQFYFERICIFDNIQCTIYFFGSSQITYSCR